MTPVLNQAPQRLHRPASRKKPKLGFLGVGWIGRHRLEAIAGSGLVEVAAIADPVKELRDKTKDVAPNADQFETFEELLDADVDGLVIATPSALHAEQAVTALEHGMAVFCQKPLGRTADETRKVVDAAQAADRLLAVDLSYRYITCIRDVHELCRSTELGDIFAIDLMFHNAYGPDKQWFYDWKLSGGGCVIDLGIHLVDLALWNLGFPRITKVSSKLFAQGKPIRGRCESVEDYAVATLDLETGATIRLACSWKLPAGCDAVISGAFYGTKGGAAFHNIEGSFYHFKAERFQGTSTRSLTCIQENWGGRAAIDWTEKLARGEKFNPEVGHLNEIATALDAIYEAAK